MLFLSLINIYALAFKIEQAVLNIVINISSDVDILSKYITFVKCVQNKISLNLYLKFIYKFVCLKLLK